MATILIATSFDLSDYLSTAGFGDGDDGAALELGFALRADAVRILNEELSRAGLDLQARAEEAGTLHNTCQIMLTNRAGKDVWLEVDGDEVVSLEEPLDAQWAAVESAWSAAHGRYEELLLGHSPLLAALLRCARLARRLADGDTGAAASADEVATQAEKALSDLGVAPNWTR